MIILGASQKVQNYSLFLHINRVFVLAQHSALNLLSFAGNYDPSILDG